MTETEIEKILKEYFENVKKREALEYQKQQLIQENKKLEVKSKGVEINFKANIPAVDYSKERLNGGKYQSDYEHQIDGFYKRIDNAIQKNKKMIINIENELLDISEKIRNIELALNFLEQETIQILKMKYIKGYSQEKIAIAIYTSRATVQRVLKKANQDIMQYLEYYS